MTYQEARLCLSDKARMIGADETGELWRDRRKVWKLIPQPDFTWDCTRVEEAQ